MIAYIDTSTLVKLLVDESGSEIAEQIWDSAETLVSSVLVRVEARAAFASAHRAARLSAPQHTHAKRGLDMLMDSLHLVEATDVVVQAAGELAESEALRGYDALHLASALEAGVDVVASSDHDLCDAARRLGLHVAP